jgi:GDP-L-fucose synthase
VTNRLYELKGKKVFVAGHKGMVGSALLRRLAGEECEIVSASRSVLDLRRQSDTEAFMARVRPQVVFVAAATVGGILANRDRPGEFIYDNLAIAANIMEAARRVGAERLVYLGSSCVYPREAPQPIPEEALLTGPLEPTNKAYAVAKIAGITLAQSYRAQFGCRFISAQPTNLYGPGDNFDLTNAHVLPALLRKAHEAARSGARELVVWGTGRALREFLHVDDLADALVFLAERYDSGEIINVGSGEEIAIADFAALIAETVGFAGELVFDRAKPDGTPRKLIDSSRLSAAGWRPKIPLAQGLRSAYAWFLEHQGDLRGGV